MKNHLIFLTVLSLVIGGYMLSHEKSVTHEIPEAVKIGKADKKAIIAPKIENAEVPKVSAQSAAIPPHLLRRRNLAQNEPKSPRIVPGLVDEFVMVNIEKTPLRLVSNFRAERISGRGKTNLIYGYEILRSEVRAEANIVHNEKTNRYGVWTREVVLSGHPGLIMGVQDQFGLIRLSPEHPIFSVPEEVSLDQISAQLPPGVDIRPDIQYSINRTQ